MVMVLLIIEGSVLFNDNGNELSFIGRNVDIGNDAGTGLPAEVLSLEGRINIAAVDSTGEVFFLNDDLDVSSFTTMGDDIVVYIQVI